MIELCQDPVKNYSLYEVNSTCSSTLHSHCDIKDQVASLEALNVSEAAAIADQDANVLQNVESGKYKKHCLFRHAQAAPVFGTVRYEHYITVLSSLQITMTTLFCWFG